MSGVVISIVSTLAAVVAATAAVAGVRWRRRRPRLTISYSDVSFSDERARITLTVANTGDATIGFAAVMLADEQWQPLTGERVRVKGALFEKGQADVTVELPRSAVPAGSEYLRVLSSYEEGRDWGPPHQSHHRVRYGQALRRLEDAGQDPVPSLGSPPG